MTVSSPVSPDPQRHRPLELLLLASFLVILVGLTLLRFPLLTSSLTLASVIIFASSFWAAVQLLGQRAAARFAALALAVGWFAEQMGSAEGWFFGHYSYTDVLGIQLGNVPLVIPLLWFALCFIAYVMASLLLWRQPVHVNPRLGSGLLTAWLAAMIVTAFDLGADPYFVFVLKAWVMVKTDGGWFGETLQGFVGWMVIACAIVATYQWWTPPRARVAVTTQTRRAVAILLLTYGGGLAFQVLFGHPIETRAIAFFAMGLPLLLAAVACYQWQTPAAEASQ